MGAGLGARSAAVDTAVADGAAAAMIGEMKSGVGVGLGQRLERIECFDTLAYG